MKKKINANFNDAEKGLIKTLLFTMGITQAEIARRLHTVPQMICDIIAGRKTTAKYQRGIARILGVEVDRIFLNKGKCAYVTKTKRSRVRRKAKRPASIKRNQK
jgi:transcriptional regulator with XRE-family HTH domain